LQSNLKVVLNRTEVWTFFPSQILRAPKVVPTLLFLPRGMSRGKVRGATPTIAKVKGAHLLNFKPIFDPFEKNSKGDSRPRWGMR